MLLFTRGIGEEIIINPGDIKIKVVIGIQMPRQMQVDRKNAFQPMLKDRV